VEDIIQTYAVNNGVGVYRKPGKIFFRGGLLFDQATENGSDGNEGKKKYGEPNGAKESDDLAGLELPGS
jgi:hypothetical protein